MRQKKSDHPVGSKDDSSPGEPAQDSSGRGPPRRFAVGSAFAASLLVALVALEAPPAGEAPFVCGRVTDADYLRLAFADLFSSPERQKLIDALRATYPGEITGAETRLQLTAFFKRKFPTCCTVTRQQTNFRDDPLEWFLSFFFYKIAEIDIGAITDKPSWQLSYDYYIDECGKMLKASRNLEGRFFRESKPAASQDRS
jgi:hypothetical protein